MLYQIPIGLQSRTYIYYTVLLSIILPKFLGTLLLLLYHKMKGNAKKINKELKGKLLHLQIWIHEGFSLLTQTPHLICTVEIHILDGTGLSFKEMWTALKTHKDLDAYIGGKAKFTFLRRYGKKYIKFLDHRPELRSPHFSWLPKSLSYRVMFPLVLSLSSTVNHESSSAWCKTWLTAEGNSLHFSCCISFSSQVVG